jgi:hypothetical protein
MAFGSAILQDTLLDWSSLLPRGHYESSDTLAGYFRALKWLGLARWKMDGPNLPATLAMAQAWSAAGPDGPQGLRTIESFANLVSGPSNGLSPADIVVAREGRNLADFAQDPAARKGAGGEDPRPRSGPASAPRVPTPSPRRISPTPFVRVFPLRWSADAEILQRLVEVKEKKRPYPSGLDVFAVRKAGPAREILLEWDSSTTTWEGWKDTLEILQRTKELSRGTDFHSQRMRLNQTLFSAPSGTAGFQKTPLWQRHVLVTNLAAWTLQKQENILYQEQANSVEAGEGGGPPPPDPKGWVDPNVEFWTGAADLVRALDSSLGTPGVAHRGTGLPPPGISRRLRLAGRRLAPRACRTGSDQRTAGPHPLDRGACGTAHFPHHRNRRVLDGEIRGIPRRRRCGRVRLQRQTPDGGHRPTPTNCGPWWNSEDSRTWSAAPCSAIANGRPPQRITDKKWHMQVEAGQSPPRPLWQNPLFVDIKSPRSGQILQREVQRRLAMILPCALGLLAGFRIVVFGDAHFDRGVRTALHGKDPAELLSSTRGLAGFGGCLDPESGDATVRRIRLTGQERRDPPALRSVGRRVA